MEFRFEITVQPLNTETSLSHLQAYFEEVFVSDKTFSGCDIKFDRYVYYPDDEAYHCGDKYNGLQMLIYRTVKSEKSYHFLADYFHAKFQLLKFLFSDKQLEFGFSLT